MTLSELVVVVMEVAMNHKTSHSELRAVYSIGCLSPARDWLRPLE